MGTTHSKVMKGHLFSGTSVTFSSHFCHDNERSKREVCVVFRKVVSLNHETNMSPQESQQGAT